MLVPFRGPRRLRVTATTSAALAVGLIAVAISAIGSWIPSLWGDEAASLLSAERPLPTLLTEVLHVDAVHGTYYLLLHGWIQLFGTSPFAIRFPSALAVGACAAAVVLIGTRMRSLPVGIAAGVVCAVLPRIAYVGAEARSYAFTAAIAAWLTLVLIAALSRHGRTRGLWIAYGVLLAVGVYMFLYLALLAVAHGVVLLIAARRRRVLVPWARAVGAAVVAASPLIVAGIAERNQIAFLASRNELAPQSVLVSIWFGQPAFAVLGWLLVLGGIAIAVVPWLRRRGGRGRRVRHPVDLLMVAWFVVPSAILMGSSPLVAGFTARYLAFTAPAVALLMTLPIALLASRWRPALVAGTALVVAAAAGPWVAERGPYSQNDSDWAVISADLAHVAKPGDAVVFDDGVRPSRRPRLALRTYPISTPLLDPTLDQPFWRADTWHDTTVSVATAAADGGFDGVTRVWVVEYATPTHTDGYGIADLERLGFTAGSTIATHRSRIIEFTRP